MEKDYGFTDERETGKDVGYATPPLSAVVTGYGAWIATCDQVPANNQPVLAIDCNGDMAVAEHISGIFFAVSFGYNAYEGNGSWESSADRITERVTHWMPLPVAP